MVEPSGDRDFLRSIFLMEAWDSLAALDDGVGRLVTGGEPAWDEVFLVSHRLRGAAALQGFTSVAALSEALEQALHALRGAPADGRASGTSSALGLLASLKSALEAIERGEAPTPAPETAAPAPTADPLRAELAAFFAAGVDGVFADFPDIALKVRAALS
jgi:chemotaxis protein histidine kinase CheA